MSGRRKRGRLFRDDSSQKPESENESDKSSDSKNQQKQPQKGPLVRQKTHGKSKHEGSLNEPPVKRRSQYLKDLTGDSGPAKTKSDGNVSKLTQDLTARQTVENINKETKKSFRAVEKWLQFFGFTKLSEGRKRTNVDLYRDTPIRLLGYSVEIGEALRPYIPITIVRGSYLLTGVYILADTMDKTVKVSEAKWATKLIRKREIEKVVIDTLVWQGLASCVIPGVVINRAVFSILYVMGLNHALPKPIRMTTTAVMCLALIPVIVKPVDKSVDFFLDHSLRKILDRKTPPK